MSTTNVPHLSEDDIRTKVIYAWLKDCGYSDSNISIEYTIPIRLGRGTKVINTRSDVLIKDNAGRNLLIIEVKKPDLILEERDKDQAISYARCLATGGIAPFAILTNGTDTRIYDSVSGELVSNTRVPLDHAFVKDGFRINGEALSARAEALQHLIGLSTENLLIFCNGQVENRMALLKDTDIDSGKKYIPQLYTKRTLPAQRLAEKLSGEDKKEVVLVVGPPQHGKTCFICATVDEYLQQGIPCLIYPAISLSVGLFEALANDFEWTFQEALTPAQVIHRLSSLLNRTDQRLLIFIDGWNEMISNAAALNEECSRLAEKKIQLILSTTSTSIPRLLKDEADNIDYIGRKINLTNAQISKLATEPLNNTTQTGLVQIGKFDNQELAGAKKLHEQFFNVKFGRKSNLPLDPFYLRLASEQYKNSSVPDFATRNELIHESLIRKARRRTIDASALSRGLSHLSAVIFSKDTPIISADIPEELCGKQLNNWMESAILIETLGSDHFPKYDFYYTHDRDYAIAHARNWLMGFKNLPVAGLTAEVTAAMKTEAGKSALLWFLSCPENVDDIQHLFGLVNSAEQTNTKLQSLLAKAIFNQFSFHGNKDFVWLEKHIHVLLGNNSNEDPPDELPELIFAYILGIDKENNQDDYVFWLRILLKSDNSIEDIGFTESWVFKLYQDGYIYSRDGYGEDSLFEVDLFVSFLEDGDLQVASRAALCISGAARNALLKEIPRLAKRLYDKQEADLYPIVGKACEYILSETEGSYYGDMCPGWLTDRSRNPGDDEENEEVYQEFIEQQSLWVPVLQYVSFPGNVAKRVEEMLADLKYHAGNHPEMEDPAQLRLEFYVDPNQLKMDL